MVPIQVTTAPQIRAFPKLNPNREQLKQVQGPPVTVFVGVYTWVVLHLHYITYFFCLKVI